MEVTLRQLTTRFPGIEEIYMFGSRRYGSGSLRSDIDILVKPSTVFGKGSASKIWGIEPYLDVFAADDQGEALSLANGSRIRAASFDNLVNELHAVPLWLAGAWCGEPQQALQDVLSGATPMYTLVPQKYLDGRPLLIVCALQKEFEMVCQRLGAKTVAASNLSSNEPPIAMAYVKTNTGSKRVVAVTVLPRMGNIASALTTLDAIDLVQPDLAILVGIAAGLKGESQLGDVVVPEVIVTYEAVKATDDGEQFHGSMLETQPQVIARIKAWDSTQWRDEWTTKRPALEPPHRCWGSWFAARRTAEGSVAIRFDAVASGEKVVASASYAAGLQGQHRKVIAIEMEATGFSAACYRRDVPFAVVKCVTDFADNKKDDRFHAFACEAPADLVARLIHAGSL